MANSCYNTISFFGNDKVIQQVRSWNAALDKFEPSKDDPHSMRAIRKVFYSNEEYDETIGLGSKWVHPDSDSTGSSEDQLGLQSAWHSPDLFLEHLACTLYKHDKNVVVENIFNIEDGTIGFRYLTPLNEKKAYMQIFECDESEPDKFEEHYLEYLTDLMVDQPNTIEVIQKFMPDLSVDWEYINTEAFRLDDE